MRGRDCFPVALTLYIQFGEWTKLRQKGQNISDLISRFYIGIRIEKARPKLFHCVPVFGAECRKPGGKLVFIVFVQQLCGIIPGISLLFRNEAAKCDAFVTCKML